MLMLLAQAADPLSGGAGWVGAGLLGCCLAWLFFVHLPAKDKLLLDLLAKAAAEREKEAKARHELVNTFQATITSIEHEHQLDAEKDRSAFERRNDSLLGAIGQQTAELRNAILAGACRFKPGDHSCPVMHTK